MDLGTNVYSVTDMFNVNKGCDLPVPRGRQGSPGERSDGLVQWSWLFYV